MLSDEKITAFNKIKVIWEEEAVAYFNALSRHSRGECIQPRALSEYKLDSGCAVTMQSITKASSRSRVEFGRVSTEPPLTCIR